MAARVFSPDPAITWRERTVPDTDIVACHLTCRGIEPAKPLQYPFNARALQRGGTPHAASNNRRLRTGTAKSGQKSSMGGAAAGCQDEDIEIITLAENLRGGIDISQRAKRLVCL